MIQAKKRNRIEKKVKIAKVSSFVKKKNPKVPPEKFLLSPPYIREISTFLLQRGESEKKKKT